MGNFSKDFIKELSSSVKYKAKTKFGADDRVTIDEVQEAISNAFDAIDFTMTQPIYKVNYKKAAGESRDSFKIDYKGNEIEIEHHVLGISGTFTYSINGGAKEVLAKGHEYQNPSVHPDDFKDGIKKLIDKMKKM